MKIDILKGKYKYLPLLLSFILIDEVCNNFIFSYFTKIPEVWEYILYSLFTLICIIASPVQAGYSDFYCRKKSLIVSLSFSLLAILLIFLSVKGVLSFFVFLPVAALLKAAFGNNLPLSLAAIADTQNINFRYSLGLSTAAMGSGYTILIAIHKCFNETGSSVAVCVLIVILIIACIKGFIDTRDRKPNLHVHGDEPSPDLPNSLYIVKKTKNLLRNEINSIVNDFLRDKRTLMGLIAFSLWEISFYIALLIDIDLKVKFFQNLSISMLIGYFFGVFILRLCNKRSDEQMITLGYICSLASLVIIFILSPLLEIRKSILLGYFFYSASAAFLAPSFFSILSRERGPHEQGKIYGLIDSVDTFSFFIAAILIIFYNHIRINPLLLVLTSLILFLISVVPYASFRNARKRET